MPVVLRPAISTDAPFLLELFASTRPELEALPEQVRTPLIAVQFEARQRGYAAAYPGSLDRVAEVDGQRVGRLLVHDAEAVRTLVDVALLSGVRGRRIGAGLVWRVIEERPGAAVVLNVARGNPAERLYRRLGFADAGGDAVYLQMRREPEAPRATR